MNYYKNNAFSVLASSASAGALTLTLSAGTGARFPADNFLATLIGYDGSGNENSWEIVRCTARAGDILTVVRAQEGTTAAAWPAAARIENRVTAGAMEEQQTALNLKANLASPELTGTPAAPTAAAGTNTTQLATTAFVQGALDAKASFVWGAVKTSAFTADNGGVYACNTSAGAFVASLPASPQPGWVATFLDYAGTFDASSLTISRNGSNIGGVADDYLLDQKNIGRNFVYADSTKGWLVK